MRFLFNLLILCVVIFVVWTYYPEVIIKFLSWIETGIDFVKAKFAARGVAVPGPNG